MPNIKDASLLFVVLFPIAMAVHKVEYGDLVAMDADCSPRDSCAGNSSRKFEVTNCECDTTCQLFDDCCVDAKIDKVTSPFTNVTCIGDESGYYRGVYVVNKCQKGWMGSSLIRQKCEVGNDISDPLISTPVTDVKTSISYKSRYCSECNDANPEDLQTWIMRVTCESLIPLNTTGNITSNYIKNKLVYKTTYPNRNKWGIFYWNNNLQRELFYPCKLAYRLPNRLQTNVRFCRPRIISTCASNWKVNSVRLNCEAYTAVVYESCKKSCDLARIYKNPHCALCNNVDVTKLLCTPDILSRKKPAMSFTLLLDIHSDGGDKVGEVNPCASGEVHDSFYGRCRKITCALAGYKLVGKKCVRQ